MIGLLFRLKLYYVKHKCYFDCSTEFRVFLCVFLWGFFVGFVLGFLKVLFWFEVSVCVG